MPEDILEKAEDEGFGKVETYEILEAPDNIAAEFAVREVANQWNLEPIEVDHEKRGNLDRVVDESVIAGEDEDLFYAQAGWLLSDRAVDGRQSQDMWDYTVLRTFGELARAERFGSKFNREAGDVEEVVDYTPSDEEFDYIMGNLDWFEEKSERFITIVRSLHADREDLDTNGPRALLGDLIEWLKFWTPREEVRWYGDALRLHGELENFYQSTLEDSPDKSRLSDLTGEIPSFTEHYFEDLDDAIEKLGEAILSNSYHKLRIKQREKFEDYRSLGAPFEHVSSAREDLNGFRRELERTDRNYLEQDAEEWSKGELAETKTEWLNERRLAYLLASYVLEKDMDRAELVRTSNQELRQQRFRSRLEAIANSYYEDFERLEQKLEGEPYYAS